MRIWFWQKGAYLEAGWTIAQWGFGEPFWAGILFGWPSVLFDAIWPEAHAPAQDLTG